MTVTERAATEVVIAIARDAALVRTARLVAAAVARRSDLSGAVIEEVRLGVGEACAILIGAVEPGTPHTEDMVRVALRHGDGFTVVVEGTFLAPDGDLDELGIDPWALLRGVTEDVTVEVDGGDSGAAGGAGRATVTMHWPA